MYHLEVAILATLHGASKEQSIKIVDQISSEFGHEQSTDENNKRMLKRIIELLDN